MRRLPARAWYLLRHAVESMVESAGTREAAQVAFFILLAFPAALLLAVWGASAALDDPTVRQKIVDGIIDVLPLADAEGRGEVERLLDGVADGAGTLGVVSVLLLIWSASAAIGALRHSIAAVWHSGEPLPYFQGKAVDVGLTLVVVPGLIAALGLNLLDVVPGALGDEPLLEGTVSLLLTELVPAVALFGVFLVLYRALPPEGATWRGAWPGALVAMAGAALVRLGAEVYFGTVANAGAVYGTIGGLLAASITAYLLAIVAVFGANFSAELARHASWRGLDEAIKRESEGPPGEPIWPAIGRLVLSLFLRRRPRD